MLVTYISHNVLATYLLLFIYVYSGTSSCPTPNSSLFGFFLVLSDLYWEWPLGLSISILVPGQSKLTSGRLCCH